MVRITINGAGGVMGKVLASMAQKDGDRFSVVAGVDRAAGTSEWGFPIYESFQDSKEECDVIVDFSVPEALPDVIEAACTRRCGLVVATTGLLSGDSERIAAAGMLIPIFVAANMSLGVNLQAELAKRAATFLGDAYDIEIVEKHHNQKIDAPSGTALMLADELSGQFADGKKYVYERHSTRNRRSKSEIGISAVRGGTVVGEHQVLFLGEDEVIEITHIAQSKRIFAVGALRAAAFLCGREPKVYSMAEILAEDNSVTRVSAEREQSIITLPQIAHQPQIIAAIFRALADASINIDMINLSVPLEGTVDISFTMPGRSVVPALQALEQLGVKPSRCIDGVAKFSIEGEGMEHQPGVAAQVFDVLARVEIDMQLVTTSETKISFCIREDQVDAAFEAAKYAFGL